MSLRPHGYVLSAALAAVALASPPCSAASDRASGRLDAGSGLVDVAAAIAFREDNYVRLYFSDRTFDRFDIAADGKLDDGDFSRHEGAVLELRLFSDDGSLFVYSLRGGGNSRSSFPSRGDALTLESWRPDRVKGRYAYDGVEVEFDLAILDPQVERPGTALPEGGGEPGQAFKAMLAAIAARDVEALLAMQPEAEAAEIREAIAAGETDEMLDMMQKMSPSPESLSLPGGRVDGDRAKVEFSGRDSFGATRGFVDLTRDEGRWRVRHIQSSWIDD